MSETCLKLYICYNNGYSYKIIAYCIADALKILKRLSGEVSAASGVSVSERRIC